MNNNKKREPASLTKISNDLKKQGFKMRPPKLEFSNIRKMTLIVEYTR